MKLKLSKRGDYVVRSAISLAKGYGADSPRKLRQVSAEMGIPRTFVSQILGDLVQAGIATSYFGANGGYRLSRSPEEITLLEIVEAGEGALESDTCVLGDEPCRWELVCPLHETWTAATESMKAELAATSLATLVDRDRAIAEGTYGVQGHGHASAKAVDVTDTVQIELSASQVVERLKSGGAWLATHLEAARADGDALLVRVGPGGPEWLTKTVAVHLGEPEIRENCTEMPLAWEATGPTGLFPHLVGVLQLVELDADRCEMNLTGHYRPPLGRTGHALNDVLLARVARATVRSFLRRISRSLEET